MKDCPIANECMKKWAAVTSSDIYYLEEEKQEKSPRVALGDAVLPVLYHGDTVLSGINHAEAIEWLFSYEVRWYHVSWGFFYLCLCHGICCVCFKLLFSEDFSQILIRERGRSVAICFIGHTCAAVM